MKNRTRKIWGKIWDFISVFVVAIFISIPIIWTFLSSIKGEKDIYSGSLGFSLSELTFSRYYSILSGNVTFRGNFPAETLKAIRLGFFNSTIVAIGTTLLCLVVGALASYVFAKNNTQGRNFIFKTIVILRFIPGVILLVPFFIILAATGLINTKIGLTLTHTSMSLPLVVWILKAFFEAIPNEIIDAAKIDGCTNLRVIYLVVVPLSAPAFVTAGLIAFITSWQEFLFALVVTTSQNAKTLPVAMAEFFGRQGFDYGFASAGAFLSIIPIIIIAFAAQRYISKGLLAGAVVG